MSGSKERWRVVDASFELSAAEVGQCPEPGAPEFAIAGRSNVGKSSLLNALCQQKGLARVSRTPGRTQLLNVFALRLREAQGQTRELRCVDLPGYGYAATRRDVKSGFGPMVEGYLRERDGLRGLVLLVDTRHGLKDSDLDLLGFVSELRLPSLLVGTKADKLGASERGLICSRIAAVVGADAQDVLLTSATSGMGIRDGQLATDIILLVDTEVAA